MGLALAVPYSLGLFAAFNPCGFPMLPAYLSYFLGLEDSERETKLLNNVMRALVVGLVMTAGFVLVFGIFGALFQSVLSQGPILSRIGYVTITVGVVMIPLGLAMALGYEPVIRLPKMNKGGDSQQLASVFMFGVSYAVVSMSCTIGILTTNLANTLDDKGFFHGVSNFVAYAVGMGSIITFLTLSLAMARTNVARNMRQILPYISRISGVMLMLAGVYLVIYGRYELRVASGEITKNSLVSWFERLQADVSNWLSDVTPGRIGIFILLAIIGALILGWRETETDTMKRRVVGVTYVAAYLIIEFGFNQGEFIVGPLVRFIAGWPARIGHWFTDPLRVGVIGEVLFIALLAWIVGRRIYGARRSMVHESAEVARP